MKSRIAFAITMVALLTAVAAVPVPTQRPIVQPFFVQFDDLNPCTGQITNIIFSGTVRVQEFSDHVLQHYSGTATLSDGFTGKFHAQVVVQGDHVNNFHEFDMEVNAAGQRAQTHVVMHTTVVDGRVTAEVSHFDLECVGRK